MKYLTKLCNKYETDKGTEFGSAHGFSEFYDFFFRNFEYPRILEIGVGNGGFEKAVNEYYDGNCEIYCIDIRDCREFFESYENIHFIQCDCGDEEKVKEVVSNLLKSGKFNVVIEDGSHFWDHQFISLLYFRRLVKKGGYFILEDLHTSYENAFSQGSNVNETPLQFVSTLLPCSFYTSEENKEIQDSIDSCVLYSRNNEKRNSGRNTLFDRSVTAILKIK